MRPVWKSVLAAGAAATLLGSATGPAWPSGDRPDPPGLRASGKAARAQAAIAGWPAYPAMAARAMMEQYGPPDELDALHLAWSRNGPWLRTVVHKTAQFPFSSQDVLEQTVIHAVPQERWPALAGFGHGVSYDPASGELSSRSSSEETNFLALNLAVDIARGRMSPEEAGSLYSRSVAESMAGRYSRYMQGLLFVSPSTSPAMDRRRQRRW
ncbi:MAG: hypothetical protein HY926_12215 [Elusimicrobia bacterium]|nr:hypothetical protein [Elusimicrobiota bacterium]